MKKRIKKKQSRLVAKWLAEHLKETEKVHHVTPIKTYTVIPQKFYATQDFSRYEYDHYHSDKAWDERVRMELARCFMNVVAHSIQVEVTTLDDIRIQYRAMLDIVPHYPSKEEVDKMYRKEEQEAYAELHKLFIRRAMEEAADAENLRRFHAQIKPNVESIPV